MVRVIGFSNHHVMKPSVPFWRRAGLAAEALIPGALTLLCVLLGATPKRFLPMADFAPMLGMVGVYYWGLFKPRLMPYWLVFVFGLLQDVLFGLPLGMSSLLWLLLRLTVASQHRAFVRETFITLWFGFGICCTAAALLYWAMLSLWNDAPMPIAAPFLQWVVTIAFYPPLHRLFNALYTKISSPIA